jgi:hypothetical protein
MVKWTKAKSVTDVLSWMWEDASRAYRLRATGDIEMPDVRGSMGFTEACRASDYRKAVSI